MHAAPFLCQGEQTGSLCYSALRGPKQRRPRSQDRRTGCYRREGRPSAVVNAKRGEVLERRCRATALHKRLEVGDEAEAERDAVDVAEVGDGEDEFAHGVVIPACGFYRGDVFFLNVVGLLGELFGEAK